MRRTHLPLNGLRVLDAAARHLSFTRAADELAVTPAAVGQQIRALEEMLGLVLFRRTPRGLELTPEAQAGLPALRQGFLEFEESVRAMQSGQTSRHLTIAAPRDFAQKWLSARLADYLRSNTGLSVALIAAENTLDFTESNVDLAILLTEGPGGHEGVALGAPEIVTVAAPGDVPEVTIHWPGCPSPEGAEAIMRVPDAGLAIDAAANGLGQTCVPALLAAQDVAQGRVVSLGDARPWASGYWLVAPLPQWRQKKVRALVEALTAT